MGGSDGVEGREMGSDGELVGGPPASDAQGGQEPCDLLDGRRRHRPGCDNCGPEALQKPETWGGGATVAAANHGECGKEIHREARATQSTSSEAHCCCGRTCRSAPAIIGAGSANRPDPGRPGIPSGTPATNRPLPAGWLVLPGDGRQNGQDTGGREDAPPAGCGQSSAVAASPPRKRNTGTDPLESNSQPSDRRRRHD